MAGDPSTSPSGEDVDMAAVPRPLLPPPSPPSRPLFSVALVCQSNVNRSMEAHRVLAAQNWPIALYSYGVARPTASIPSLTSLSFPSAGSPLTAFTGSKVRLPGRSPREANVFDFGTPYTTIIERLTRSSEKAAASIPATLPNAHQKQQVELHRYTTMGIIPMLQRDATVKHAPERWLTSPTLPHFDLVLTFETRVYDTIVTSLALHGGWRQRVCHVVNVETPDRTVEAAESGRVVREWMEELVGLGERWEEGLEESLVRLQEKHGARLPKPVMHFVWWY